MPYRIFDHYATRYDAWYTKHPVTAENEAKLVEYVSTKHPIAEIGAGTGYFASRIYAEAAIDPSLAMLEEGKRKKRFFEPIQALGEQLPLRSSSIATTLLAITLCFLDNPYPVLREAHRVLKPRGHIVACIVPRESTWGTYYLEKARQGHPLYRYARFYTVRETIELLQAVGFTNPLVAATISYGPHDPPRPEEPRILPPSEAEKRGFACIVMEKPPSTQI
jgi:ubiquinone/menaquinone biosynthesis C-methylase UbiE